MRVLRVVRGSAKRDRTRPINQMRSLISTAPDDPRRQVRGLTIPKLVRRAPHSARVDAAMSPPLPVSRCEPWHIGYSS